MHTRTILLVDDDPLVRSVIAEELEEAGHIVVGVSNGRAALERIAAGDPFDLALVDYSMPSMNGRAVVEAIRHLRPELPMALLTGHAVTDETRAAGVPVLDKAARMGDLLRHIDDLARGALVAGVGVVRSRIETIDRERSIGRAAEGVARHLHAQGDEASADPLPDAMAAMLGRLGQDKS